MRTPVFLYSGIASFFLGVTIGSLAHINISTVLFVFLIAAGLFLYYVQSRTFISFIVPIALVIFLLGIGRVEFAKREVSKAKDSFGSSIGEQMIEGVVVDEVIGKDTSQRFTVQTPETRITVTSNRFPKVSYGDKVALSGEVKEPEKFETETGRVFDYPQFLAAKRITHQMFYPNVATIGSQSGNIIKRALFIFKEKFLDRIRTVVPEPHAALLGGLVVGTQEAMGESLLDAFRVTGLIHIVVLSGYNITIVAESLMRFFGFLPKRIGIIIGAVAIVLFAILTGGTATIVRASIMALLVLAAKATGRQYEIIRALFVTAFLMVLYNPYILLFDPSFQLSFLATLGLIYFVPLLERITTWMSAFPTIQSFVLATIATQLFVLPLLLYQVGLFSTISVLVNVLVLPVVPTVMLLGLLTGIFGFVHPFLALPFGFISYLLLGYILKIVDWFSELPFVAVNVENFSGWLVVVMYIFYAIALFYVGRISKKV